MCQAAVQHIKNYRRYKTYCFRYGKARIEVMGKVFPKFSIFLLRIKLSTVPNSAESHLLVYNSYFFFLFDDV